MNFERSSKVSFNLHGFNMANVQCSKLCREFGRKFAGLSGFRGFDMLRYLSMSHQAKAGTKLNHETPRVPDGPDP